MLTGNYNLVPTRTLNASFNSIAYPLTNVFGYAIQGVIVGTPTGTVKLQSSCDVVIDNVVPTNWSDIDDSSQTVSGAGTFEYNVTDVGYTYVRLVYTDGSSGSSTATMSATINSKGI